MNKRLFFALTIPQPLKDEIMTNFKRSDVAKIISRSEASVVKSENLHITVLFLNSVDETLIPGLIKISKKICANYHTFSLKVKSVSLAPRNRKPTMIWAVFEENKMFYQIVYSLNKSVKKYFQKHKYQTHYHPHRKSIPHMTLARLKMTTSNMKLPPISIKYDTVNCSSIALVESKISKSGAKYQILVSFPFNEKVVTYPKEKRL